MIFCLVGETVGVESSTTDAVVPEQSFERAGTDAVGCSGPIVYPPAHHHIPPHGLQVKDPKLKTYSFGLRLWPVNSQTAS